MLIHMPLGFGLVVGVSWLGKFVGMGNSGIGLYFFAYDVISELLLTRLSNPLLRFSPPHPERELITASAEAVTQVVGEVMHHHQPQASGFRLGEGLRPQSLFVFKRIESNPTVTHYHHCLAGTCPTEGMQNQPNRGCAGGRTAVRDDVSQHLVETQVEPVYLLRGNFVRQGRCLQPG